MSKDAYWFRHDSNSGRGSKMMKMQLEFSHWGKGVYWDVVEVLREQEGYRYEHSDSDLKLLSILIHCDDFDRFKKWFFMCVEIGLFYIEEKYFFCAPLTENMKKWDADKSNGSKGGRPKHEQKKGGGYTPPYNPTSKKGITIRGDKKRIKESKKESTALHFFEDSEFFEPTKFKQALPDWSPQQLRHYYDALLAYSNKGNKYRNWVTTAKNWANKDAEKKEGFFTPKKVSQGALGTNDCYN